MEKEELKVEEEMGQKVEELPTLQGEWRSAETQQSPGDEDDPEEEELSFTHDEREDLHLRKEQRHREEEDEEEEEAEYKLTEKVGFLSPLQLLLALSHSSKDSIVVICLFAPSSISQHQNMFPTTSR